MKTSDFGVIGLGVMGKSISLNIADNGFAISVYNRSDENEANIVSDFLAKNKNQQTIYGFTNLQEFINSIKRPRKILLMIKAGDAVDNVINQLESFLDKDDIIIDGGNSHFKKTIARATYLAEKEIHFVGCGISGGEYGARNGPSIMPGCAIDVYQKIAPVLEKIASKDKNNKPCCTHIGTDGAGHFIKMIHNGIEYAEMQLLAETYSLLKQNLSNNEIANLFENWNNHQESSYLLEITIAILKKKENNNYLLDNILDKAKSKGTGSWSSQIALELGIPASLISSAVFMRFVSSLKEKRVQLSKNDVSKKTNQTINIDALKNAYRFARIINHQQGFAILQKASKEYHWDLNLFEIARIWTNGCIIRSSFMENSVTILKNFDDYFDDETIVENLYQFENDITKILQFAMNNRIALDSFSNTYNYWIAMTTENSSANLIQAQRDFFGAHTYQRIDSENQTFHTNWQTND